MDIKTIRDNIKALYSNHYNTEPENLLELPRSGSNRRYFRVSAKNTSVIATYNEDKDENKAFFYLAKHLRETGVAVPDLIAVDEQNDVYIQEDLGDVNLYQCVVDAGIDEDSKLVLYKKVIDQMPKIQHHAAKDLDFSICYPREAFDDQSMVWDLNYFKYLFLKTTYIPFHEEKLEIEFKKLVAHLQEAPSDFFLFRDFQSRNIMVKDGEPYFIDFQGGRRGALQYDLASLLFESKTQLSDSFREEILNYYIKTYSAYSFFNQEQFLKYYPAFAMVRLLQAFGAYGYRGIFEKKAFFVQSILNGLQNLAWLVKQTQISEHFPYLCEIIESMMVLKDRFPAGDEAEGLTVSITSFSYKIGVPDDWTGNGGGFVFDCRSLPNPGRHESYRSLTGRDTPVIDYLEKEPDVHDFIESVSKLASSSVERYQQRGFTNLSISFGCTGGQHRSVYSAEKLAQYIHEKYKVNVQLIHREQNIRSTLH